MTTPNDNPTSESDEMRISVRLCTNTIELCDIVENLHIIVGPNGKCMCGGPYASEMLTCQQILGRLSKDAQNALIIANSGGQRL